MSVLSGACPGLARTSDGLISVLRRHAELRPDQPAFVFPLDNQAKRVLTYSQLDRRARAIAAHLQELEVGGRRVLLAYPHGPDFIEGFFGCLYAGCAAVPICLPHRRTLGRFRAIADDAGAHLVLSTASAAASQLSMIGPDLARRGTVASLPWIATDEVSDANAERWEVPDFTPDTLAMLQYTSGSTSQPKGVMLTHANLIQSTRAIFEAFGMGCKGENDIGVFWLPTYHDMGLVGGVLTPMLAGVTSIMMAPATFLQEPMAWLAAISKHRATISGGPNFAYDLCVRKITDDQRATLDLSCWRLAFIGAEPIQPETLERFAAAFAPCGFKPDAFYPCYGLAEATLMVSGAVRDEGPTVRSFNEAALAEHRVESVADGASEARRLVSCGSHVAGLRIEIVDADDCTRVVPGRVGEVWLAGGSVGVGYWEKTEQSCRSFAARLHDTGEGPFLRTGDLGFMLDDELYIIGRQDDLLIVRGLNHHPQDLEATARDSHPAFATSFGAAFCVHEPNGADEQRIVLVLEAIRSEAADFTPALEAIREAVLAEHGLGLHSIVLVRCGTIPRTSSGKVQRHACREAFLAGELKILAEYHRPRSLRVPAESGGPAADIKRSAPRTSESSVLATVCQHAIALGGAAMSDVSPETTLAALGLDSLQRVELAATLEKSFACRLPDADFNPAQTLGELALAVQSHRNGHSKLIAPSCRIPREHYDFVRFPEYGELKRYERILKAVAGENPYFRVDEGGAASASIARIAERDLINFSIYDYVGLARDSEVAAAAKAAIDRYGTSAGASRLVSGEKRVHRDLEQALAAFLGTSAAIVFVSGHATNVTTIGHLFGPEDLIVHDALAHNSIIQGAQLSRATRRAFAHNDWLALDALLTEVRPRFRRVLIAIEGVYSMDGDSPDLSRFVTLKKKHKALLLVDEAHSLGTMGPTGRGIGEHCGVARADVDLWMGTLSKSLASCGGYIAGSAGLVEYLAYTAPGFVYSVGISPANAAAALAALTVLQQQPQRVSRLRELSVLFLSLAKERGLHTGASAGTPVIPVIVGSSVKTLRLARALFDRGISVQPILPPAVPEPSARLRFFITTNHTEAQIRDTVGAIADELARL